MATRAPAHGSRDGCEAFVSSFVEVTRSMEAQCRSLARKVSLAQLLDGGYQEMNDSAEKENTVNDRANAARKSSATAAVNEHVLDDLRSLDSILSDLERRAASMRGAIDDQRRDNTILKQLTDQTRRQTEQLAATCTSLPEHLPFPAATAPPEDPTSRSAPPPAAANPTRKRGERQVSRAAIFSAPPIPVLELVTISELEEVPRSTRARLTIAQVNAAVTDIQKAMEKRQAFMSKPRNKMSQNQLARLEELKQQEVPAHGGQPFIVEPDLRALPAFKKGEITAKALIATLRSLKRLKGVRAAGVMTYVVLER